MPKGKAPRRSDLYSNYNETYLSDKGKKVGDWKGDETKGVRVSNDMRPDSPKNLKDRIELTKTGNFEEDYKSFSKKDASDKSRSLGRPHNSQVTPGDWTTKDNK